MIQWSEQPDLPAGSPGEVPGQPADADTAGEAGQVVSRTADARRVASGGAPAKRRRWRTVFVEGKVLAAAAAGLAASDPSAMPDAEAEAESRPPLQIVARLDEEVAGVRKNVRDAAAAVMAWLSAVVGHEGKTDLDDVLDRCLRPGPDPLRVNYAAMAADIFRVTGVELTAKRVQTAVSHLRAAHEKSPARQATHLEATDAVVSLGQRLAALSDGLREQFDALTAAETAERETARRTVGTEVLTAVRSAAGRVIDRGFGEGIPEAVDLPALEGRFLEFVGQTLREHASAEDAAPDVAGATGDRGAAAEPGVRTGVVLRRLLLTLADHDATAEADMKLVMHGSAAVKALLGVDSLPGLLAHLNVLVAGRALIDDDLYVAEMLRLAGSAEALQDDAATRRYLGWNRRRPEDQRLPSAVRVASYARSNAATRLLDGLYDGRLEPDAPAWADAVHPPRSYRQLAEATHDAMLAADSGFTLTLTTELIRHLVMARLDRSPAALEAYLQKLGPEKALARLEALIRFENNDELVAEARRRVVGAHPALRRQLVCVR